MPAICCRLLLPLFLLTAGPALSAQSGHPKALYFELAGSGGIASANYEQGFFQRDRLDLRWRAGFSFAPIDRNNGTALVFPLMAHALLGSGRHQADFGGGQTFSITTKGRFFLRMPLSLGYRYSPLDANWFFRVSYTPIISFLVDFQFQHWAGISFGYQFPSR